MKKKPSNHSEAFKRKTKNKNNNNENETIHVTVSRLFCLQEGKKVFIYLLFGRFIVLVRFLQREFLMLGPSNLI